MSDSSYAYDNGSPRTEEYISLCQHQNTMLNVYWAFAVLWVILFLTWFFIIGSHCVKSSATGFYKNCKPLLWLFFIVPFFHLGDACWQLYTYHFCRCMHCTFQTYGAYMTWLGTHYTFWLGRLSALLLCLFLVSTGAGTVRPRLLMRNVATLLLLFGGFLTAMALNLPTQVLQMGIDARAAFVASIFFYGALLVTILSEAHSNSRVLKAQLLMIRDQGIDPRTCPAYAKLRLFTRLRRWVFGYFALHTFIIITQQVPMQLWQSILLLVIWEMVQLAITAVFGRLFWSSNKTNAYLEREEHLPTSEVVNPMTADEVTLSWDDLHNVVEDSAAAGGARTTEAAHASLLTWQEGTLVPAPPAPPPMISVFGMGGGARTRRNRTGPAQGAAAAAATTSSTARPVQGVPVASATLARPGGVVTEGTAIEMGSINRVAAPSAPLSGNTTSRSNSPREREGVTV